MRVVKAIRRGSGIAHGFATARHTTSLSSFSVRSAAAFFQTGGWASIANWPVEARVSIRMSAGRLSCRLVNHPE